MPTLPLTTLTFPEVCLQARDAHKLRGYFGDLFREHSPLLHNHYADEGTSIYRYPQVQYKVLNHIPTLVGVAEGAKLLIDLFLSIKELNIGGVVYPVLHKNLQSANVSIGVRDDLMTYEFQTLWMALNQHNYQAYIRETPEERSKHLKQALIGNILTFYKGVGLRLEPQERILAQVQVEEKTTQFKNQQMLAFSGRFTTNALLPDGVGIGKSPARGFGTIRQITNVK